MTPPRVLLVINGLDFGGTESNVAHLARGLRAAGVVVEILCLKPIARLGLELREEGVPVHSLNMSEKVGMVSMVQGSWALWRWLRRREFEVIHSFLPRANVMSRIAKRLSGHGCLHFSNEESTDLQRSKGVSILNRLTLSLTDRVLAVSEAVRDTLVKRDRIPGDRIDVLTYGIDLAHVDATPPASIRETLGIPRDAPLLCSVGRLVVDKGHVYVIRALAGARDVEPGAWLLIAGEGPEEGRLREEARRLGLQQRVVFLGFQTAVLGLLKACDVFVLPSLEEGLPVTVVEAMACGLPVIASDVGGIRSLVVSGETGLLVPPAELWRGRDPAGCDQEAVGVRALTAAIRELAWSPDRRRAMGLRGRRWIESRFSFAETLARLRVLYGFGERSERKCPGHPADAAGLRL